MPKTPHTDKELDKIEREFIQAVGSVWSRFGFNRTSGMILGALYLADADIPLTANDLARLLHVSRSTLSASLSELEAASLISASKTIGSRQEQYKTFTDPRDIALAAFRLWKRRDVEPLLSAAIHAEGRIPNNQSCVSRHMRDRLRRVVRLYSCFDLWVSHFGKLSKEQYEVYLRLPHERLEKLVEEIRRVEGKDSGAA